MSSLNLCDTDAGTIVEHQLWWLVDDFQAKFGSDAGAHRRSLQHKGPSAYKPVSSGEKNEFEIATGMTLEEKRVTLDAESTAVLQVQERAYPGYSFVNPSQYSHPEHILFHALFATSTFPKTLEVSTFLAHTRLTEQDLEQTVHEVIHTCPLKPAGANVATTLDDSSTVLGMFAL